MKGFLPILSFLFIGQVMYAQQQGNIGRMNDNVVTSTKRMIVDVKPVYLFNENYLDADIHTPTGKIIPGNKLRLDLQENKLYYLEGGVEMEVVNPVSAVFFRLPEGENSSIVIFQKGYPAVDKQNENNFYQVLVSGKATLLMDTKFRETEHISFGTGIVNNTEKLLSYYGASGNKIVQLAKTENIVELLSDRSKEIKEYIQQESIKVKRQPDLAKVFTYYNSLFK